METIESRLRRFRTVRPPERLRERILNLSISEWSAERTRWRRTLLVVAALLIVAGTATHWSERSAASRLARMSHESPAAEQTEVVERKLDGIVPDETESELRHYLADRLLAPPRHRSRGLSALTQQMSVLARTDKS